MTSPTTEPHTDDSVWLLESPLQRSPLERARRPFRPLAECWLMFEPIAWRDLTWVPPPTSRHPSDGDRSLLRWQLPLSERKNPRYSQKKISVMSNIALEFLNHLNNKFSFVFRWQIQYNARRSKNFYKTIVMLRMSPKTEKVSCHKCRSL